MRGTRPAGVSSQAIKPGTRSLTTPPPAESGGPQQEGLSDLADAIGENSDDTGASTGKSSHSCFVLRWPLALIMPLLLKQFTAEPSQAPGDLHLVASRNEIPA